MMMTAKPAHTYYDVMDYVTGEYLGRARWLPKTVATYERVSERDTGAITAADLERYCGVRLAVAPERVVFVVV